MDLSERINQVLSFLFSVANGEPPIGIPWETFQKIAKNTSHLMRDNKCKPRREYGNQGNG